MPPAELKAALFAEAKALGIDSIGVAPIQPELRREYYQQWIADGKHGNMAWMERNNDRRLNPENILPEARSIICVGINYYQPQPEQRGRIARYALGGDYHDVLLKKLKRLCTWLREQGYANKPYVDTGPVLEKPIAEQAGLGWQAKNTMLINKEHGNWLFLGEIFTTAALPVDEGQQQPNRCGTCSRCIQACPTKAITAPYQLDARKCISYLTIEHHGPIPEEYREAIGGRVYGCDECLDVCPWNKWAQITREAKFAARELPDLRETLAWSDDAFRETFRGSPIKRLKLNRWKRNACIVLGNIGTADDLPSLEKASEDADAVVAESARWAIRKIKG